MPEVAAVINETLAPADYALAAGDVVNVSFINNDPWNHSRVVPPDGVVSFLGVDEMSVVGLSTAQVDERLTAAYSSVTGGGADVTVNLQELGDRTVTVLGQVLRPGVFPIHVARGEHTTLLDALAFAGGPSRDRAHLGSVVLVRWDAEQQKQLAWTIDARQKFWGTDPPILVQNHDLVFVPQTTIDKVDVWVDKYIRQLLPFPQFFIPAPQ